jgi:signal peptidase
MIKNKYLIILTYSLLIITIILSIFIVPTYYRENVRIFNLLIWISIFHIAVLINAPITRSVSVIERIKTVIIIIFTFYILYLLVGIWTGYNKSPYSHSFIAILKNILFIYGLQYFQEYVRTKLVNTTNNFFVIAFITIIFIIVKLNFINVSSNFETIEGSFKYFTSIFAESINGILLTYLSISGGFLLNITYSGLTSLFNIFIPIFPDIDWFLDVILKLVLVLIIYLFIEKEKLLIDNKIDRRDKKENVKANILKEVPGIIILLILIQFIIGLFPIMPMSILSNSMYPTFSRGYLVISKKIDKENVNEIKIGDIIVYERDGIRVVHRVTNIYINEYFVRTFVTKGDNNSSPDYGGVYEDQISGLIILSIPLLGYPSVWISEYLFNIKPNF